MFSLFEYAFQFLYIFPMNLVVFLCLFLAIQQVPSFHFAVFMFLPLSHTGSFTSTSTLQQSHPHIKVILHSLSPYMALCCCYNARGQAVRSLTTGELQASLNLHHPVHRELTSQQSFFQSVTSLLQFYCP